MNVGELIDLLLNTSRGFTHVPVVVLTDYDANAYRQITRVGKYVLGPEQTETLVIHLAEKDNP